MIPNIAAPGTELSARNCPENLGRVAAGQVIKGGQRGGVKLPQHRPELVQSPEPRLGAALSKTQIAAALRRGGRTRRIDERTAMIQAALRAPQLQPPPVIAAAMGASVAAQASVTGEMTRQIAVLEQQLAADFEQHPDAGAVRSLPGLGTILGARCCASRRRAGPLGHRQVSQELRRHITHHPRLGHQTGRAGPARPLQAPRRRHPPVAFSAITASPGARTFYDTRRAAGDTHHQALRALGNHLVGFLHGCLTSHTAYGENIAWSHRPDTSHAKTA